MLANWVAQRRSTQWVAGCLIWAGILGFAVAVATHLLGLPVTRLPGGSVAAGMGFCLHSGYARAGPGSAA
jgi:hypothetical protein